MDKIYLDCLPCVPAREVLDRLIPLFNYIVLETIEKEAGLSNRNYFYRLFEESYGMTPLEFRERHRAKLPSAVILHNAPARLHGQSPECSAPH